MIQFAGRIDAAGLVERGVAVYPGLDLPARRMSMTLGALGPRPVIELHAAGLKVGELALRDRQTVLTGNQGPRSIWQILNAEDFKCE